MSTLSVFRLAETFCLGQTGGMKLWRVRWGDLAVAFLFVAAILFSFFSLKRGKNGTSRLIIMSGKDTFVYSMNKSGTYRIPGLLGDSTICVEAGKAWFVDSPCPNKNCVHQGKISATGEWAACLPNDVFIRIEGSDDGLDGVSF